jgi:hypothetical protein
MALSLRIGFTQRNKPSCKKQQKEQERRKKKEAHSQWKYPEDPKSNKDKMFF